MRDDNRTTVSTKAELTEDGRGRISRVITFGNKGKVEIPINRDGSVKWFDDSRLLKHKNK